MNKKILFGRSIRDLLIAITPVAALLGLMIVAYIWIKPTPPSHIVITTSDDQAYAKLYKEIMKQDGVTLEIRPSSGAMENLKRLQDPHSDVDVGFVQDGLGSSEEAPDLSSLGSLYYEPIWIFYRNKTELTKISQLAGKRIALGRQNAGTTNLSRKLKRSPALFRSSIIWCFLTARLT
jgi:TRAP-type uncharacterized transport system substrate-binding protein